MEKDILQRMLEEGEITQETINELSNGKGDDETESGIKSRSTTAILRSPSSRMMSNSKLVSYTRISPNKNCPRSQDIYIITPHCVVGQVTVERLGEIFANPNREASSNYGVGYDGRVGMYVEEKDRSWCTSSAWNDNRAVTIEVASDTYDPYAITDAAYHGLIDLMTDICKRNGKSKLIWFGSREKTLNYTPKSDEMIITVHRWFDTKACPGNYIFNRLGAMAAEVTRRLESKPEPVIGFVRYAGKDRYNTSKSTINNYFESNTGVTLVSGTDYADALSAAYFAKQKNAPLLLTNAAVEDDTVKYIKERPNIENVYIIGGEGAIPKSIEGKLSYLNVQRIAGANRYETNLEILKQCDTPNAQIIVASGQNFPDGLCAGMIYRPVLLVNKFVKQEAMDFLRERNLKTFYIFGGEGVVNTTIAEQLAEIGEVNRFAGKNRYETSKIIAQKFYPKSTNIIMASGKSYADGLCASNLGDAPLLLIDPNNTIEARKYISTLSLRKVEVVGGKGVLSDNTVDWALTKL